MLAVDSELSRRDRKKERTRREIASREGALRAELEAVALALKSIEETVDTLTRRVKRALDESSPVDRNGWAPVEVPVNEAVAVVVHGVPSARIALSLQRYLASLPQVAAVSAREFAGGVLRLDARVRERLHVAHLRGWEDGLVIQTLTERPTANLEAYDAFLKGEASGGLDRRDPQSLRNAINYYEQAVALDSTFAAAWAALGRAHGAFYFNVVPTPAAAAKTATDRAIALAPGNAHDRIVIDSRVCHGKPVIRGTRMPVSLIVGSLAGGMSFKEVEREYSLTRDDIRAALKFAGESADL